MGKNVAYTHTRTYTHNLMSQVVCVRVRVSVCKRVQEHAHFYTFKYYASVTQTCLSTVYTSVTHTHTHTYIGINTTISHSRYKYDVDKTLAQVRFITPSNKVVGVINWFAVHPTSMNNTNRLISSDNVGYASLLMEKALNGNHTLPGKVSLVYILSLVYF